MDVVDVVASGGVVMPMPKLLGLGEMEFENWEGILYLEERKRKSKRKG